MSALAELACDTCLGNCRCTDQPKPETCNHKGCIEAEEDLYRCEECNQRFCRSHVKRVDSFYLCADCSEREQSIIGSSVRSLEMVIERAKAGKYLTDDDFRMAVRSWWEEIA